MKLDTATEIIQYIKNAPKRTDVKLYAKGRVNRAYANVTVYNLGEGVIAFGEYALVEQMVQVEGLTDVTYEVVARNSAIPLLDIKQVSARIEPGAYIREHVEIGEDAVIMMGAIINIGAKIGKKTMIDMNAVIGGRAEIGASCHIGAGAVVAGVIEPASAQPVVIGDNVLVGANAVLIEGVQVGAKAIIGAGAVVTTDIPPGAVAVGNPARVVKIADEQLQHKTAIVEDLR